MMHGREKSDSVIVAGKPTNKAVSTAAEPVERRAEAKGNASQQSTRRTQSRVSVSQARDLRNVVANYPFERSHRFAGIQPNSGFGDCSRLSCGVGDTQLRFESTQMLKRVSIALLSGPSKP